MTQQSLEIRQSQSLVMTQQLRQSIELLQLSANELQELVENELEKNPLLTVSEEVAEPSEKASEKVNDSPLDLDEGVLWGSNDDNLAENIRYEGAYDGLLNADYAQIMAERITQPKDLHQELITQIKHKSITEIELKMAQALIDMIDVSGYLPLDYESRAQAMGIDTEHLQYIVRLLHECEPTGVGARNLQECLQLQLQERGELDAIMSIILENLQLIAEGNHKKLCRLCGIEPHLLPMYIAKIKACNPKPASDYNVTTPQTLIPDVLVKRGADDAWEVELNQDILPKIAIDERYLKNQIPHDKADGKAIGEYLSNANWLLKSLQQRYATLLNVTSEIVKRQEDFLNYGVAYLQPMTLKDIALAAGCHESTVSRITTQKYMATERGVFELKYFFNSNLVNANGGSNYSSRSVMHMIAQLIKAETKSKVLSDEAIAAELQKQGVEVARRTVVKYRKQLGIAPSNQRKKSQFS
jgi:RNA polymerase sigma-54 factor